MSAARPCQDDLTAAVACINLANPGQCSCLDPETFSDQFERDVRSGFLSTQAFAAPSDPTYCEIANKRICQFTELNYSCCCQDEISAYQKCLVETVLPQELPAPVAYETSTCQNICPPPENEGSSLPILIGCAVGIAVVLCMLGALVCQCRRRRRAMRNAKLDIEEDTKTSPSGAFEEPKGSESTQLFNETTMEEPIDLEIGGKTPTTSDDESLDPTSTAEEPVYKATMTPSKAFMDEAEEIDDSGKDLKGDILKKKRAIENWNKDRKQGSNRSLQSYLNEDDDDANPIPIDEDKKKPKRSSSRHLLDTKEDNAQTSEDKKKSRRFSARQGLEGEDEEPSNKEQSKDGKKKDKDSSTAKPRRPSSRNNLLDAEEDDRKKDQDSKTDLPRRSSSSRLDSQGQDSSPEKIRRSTSRNRLDGDEDGQRENENKKGKDSGTDKIRRSSSRNRLDGDDEKREKENKKKYQDSSPDKIRRSSSRNLLDAADEQGKKPRRSSSGKNRDDDDDANKKKIQDSSTDKIRRSSSRNRLDGDIDDSQKPRRSSSRNRLDADDHEGQKPRQASSRNADDVENQRDNNKKDQKKSKESSTDKPRRSSSRANLNEDDRDGDDTKDKVDRKKSKESSTDQPRRSSSRSLRGLEDDEERQKTSSRRRD